MKEEKANINTKDPFEEVGLLFQKRDFESIIDLMLKVYSTAVEEEDLQGVNKASGVLLQAYYASGNYQKAFFYGKDLLSLLENKEHKADSNVYLYMAILYFELEEYCLAEFYLRKILLIDPKDLSTNEVIQVNFNLALICSDMERHDEAYEYLQEVYTIILTMEKPPEVVIYYYHTLACGIDVKARNLSSAYTHLEEAEKSTIYKDIEQERVYYYRAAALYYEAIRDHIRKIEFLEKGYELTCKHESKGFKKDFLATIYKHRNDIEDTRKRMIYAEAYIEIIEEFLTITKEINVHSLSMTAEKFELNKDIYTDHLTGLKNRPYMEAYFEEYQHHKDMVCVLIDVDDLRSVNQAYGLKMGDEVLRKVALSSNQLFDEVGVVARYGGDKFIVVTMDKPLEQVLERLRILHQQIEDLSFDTFERPITVSSGLANSLGRETHSMKMLLAIADDNLQQAKKMGKNQICRY